ncbi:MAG: hypothetical protein ACYC1Z_03530 [Georgenia sp.]
MTAPVPPVSTVVEQPRVFVHHATETGQVEYLAECEHCDWSLQDRPRKRVDAAAEAHREEHRRGVGSVTVR